MKKLKICSEENNNQQVKEGRADSFNSSYFNLNLYLDVCNFDILSIINFTKYILNPQHLELVQPS